MRAARSWSCLLYESCVVLLLAAVQTAQGQSPLFVYTDQLVNGFQDWSWVPSRNLANTSPVHSGSHSISATAVVWQGLSFWHPDIDATGYTNIEFWANGGSTGGQKLQIYAEYGTNSGPTVQLGALPANSWQLFQISFAKLGLSNVTNLNRFSLQLTSSGTAGTFYVDDVQITPKPTPSVIHLTIDASRTIRQADSRWFGLNTAVWDGNLDSATTIALLRQMGTAILRFPGGSLSDEYHWASNRSGTNTFQWASSFANFAHVATNIGAQAFLTVNYGTGTPAEAAGWVRHSNVTNHFAFKYWEIGNENYGTWETDTNVFPHDPYTYAVRAADYYKQMKAADPAIKVGVAATPGDDSFSNGYSSHPARNLRTGQSHNGWTPVMLSTLKSLGVTPDFIVHHQYPEFTQSSNPTGSDSDSVLLQSSTAWFTIAAQLRQEISDYFGPTGTNIELVCSENNSDSGAQGRQSTSLVNGLYYADSLAQLMKTEFNSLVWWDLRNGTDTNGSFDADLYGWRTYGDLGMINGSNTRHPTFFAAKLMRFFVHPGDVVVGASSDYPLLSVYAARSASGALSVLVIHKDRSTNLDAQIQLSGFVPDPSALARSYGILQDEATRTNGSLAAQDLAAVTLSDASTNFSASFSPYSMTLLSLAPQAPNLLVNAGSSKDSPLTLTLRGQAGVRYVIQSATDLDSWSSVATNTLASDTWNLSYAVDSGPRYWRALWQP